ncbi:hypothetical protein A9Q84_09410 [Halobacteriovorax marinus]|uniref:Uncharacterized protein n=1 Tax=Halobacteriovorax marinus TaxID=97084 RepID=A0A1Y5F6M7_9BACT|nr:hypothetical protein A9Q84_09410 [Halobacteriovorax marinus]
MKGMITTVLLLVLSFNVSAKDQTNTGDGRFVSVDGDSLTFIKKQLIYSSFKDLITKELSLMGHSSEVFWTKYNEKFESYFSPIQEKLDKAYGVTKETPLTDKKKERYDRVLRVKKLTLKARYGKLHKVISSYSVKKMSRSPQFPNSRYMSIHAKVNKSLLNSTFYRFTRSGQRRNYNNLFVTVDFSLKNMAWQDLGVELENDFTSVLKEHWKRWFEDHFKGKITNIILTNSSEVEKLDSHLKILSESSSSLNEIAGRGQEIENAETNAILSVDDQLVDSLWLKIKVNIRKVSDDLIFNKRTFHFGGEYLLFDLKSNRLASHHDFISEEATYSTKVDQKLSSNTASLVYRLPVGKWQRLIKDVSHFPLGQRNFNLELFGASSVKQIDEVKEYLSSLGLTNNLKVTLDSFNRDRALLKIHFKGNVVDLKSTILKSKDLEVDRNKTISFANEENPFAMNLIEKTSPSVNSNENKGNM